MLCSVLRLYGSCEIQFSFHLCSLCEKKKHEVGSVGVTKAEVSGRKYLTQAVLSGEGFF
jgi:hypothetical protein